MKGIYLITNLENNKKYIGQSINIERRWKDHIRYSKDETKHKACPKLYKAISKYGEDKFKFEVLEDYKDWYSLSGFSKICWGETFKHLPIYNKASKTWNK